MLAEAAIRNLGEMRGNVKKIVGERKRVFKALREEDAVQAFPSETNFILFRAKGGVARAAKLHEGLMRKGFVLRSYSTASGIGDCLRLTIGTLEVNDRFLAALREASR